MVSSGHALVSEAGALMLDAGGNAFDAAVAATFATFVCEPSLTSPGGGGFLMACPSDGKTVLYDFFTDVPGRGAGLSKDGTRFFSVYVDFAGALQEVHIGEGSAAVPGVLAGLDAVARRHGRLPLKELMAPAISYARDGVRVNASQGYFMKLLKEVLTITPETSAIFAPGGEFVSEGDLLKNPSLADTFDHLAREGVEDFYRGGVAEALLASFGREGYITREDLEGYRVVARDPLALSYRGKTVHINPPPSSGGCLVAFAIKLLDGFDPASRGHNTADYLELLARVKAATNAARLKDFNLRVYEEGMEREFLSPERVEYYSAMIREGFTRKGGGAGRGTDGDPGNTTHVSVVDSEGNAASVTTTSGIGGGYMVPGTGIMMNNMLGEEDINPLGFHAQAPGTRMSSMMAPTVVAGDGGPEIVLGTGGSKRIRSAVLQVILNLVDHGLPVREAVNAPRVHIDTEGILHAEAGIAPGVLDELESRGLRLNRWDTRHMFFGGVHTVVSGPEGLSGSGDERRGGETVER